jgi:hypothetical protein
LGLHAAATVAATAAAATASGCPFGRGGSFCLSFERLWSPRKKVGKIQDEEGVQVKRARERKTQNEKEAVAK